MKLARHIVCSATLAAMVALVGCATPYQPNGMTGGFTETQLDVNVFRVTFRGNAATAAERAEDMTLLRSAELAMQHGFNYFAVVSSRADVNVGTFTTPTQTSTTGMATTYGNTTRLSAQSTTTGGQAMTFRKPSSTNTIVCFKERPEGPAGIVFDARFVWQSLSAKYEIKR